MSHTWKSKSKIPVRGCGMCRGAVDRMLWKWCGVLTARDILILHYRYMINNLCSSSRHAYNDTLSMCIEDNRGGGWEVCSIPGTGVYRYNTGTSVSRGRCCIFQGVRGMSRGKKYYKKCIRLSIRKHRATVCKAFWPAHLRKSMRTNGAAQHRRVLVLHYIWYIDTLTMLRLRCLHFFSQHIRTANVICCMHTALFLLTVALFIGVSFFYNWSMPANIAIISILILMRLFIKRKVLRKHAHEQPIQTSSIQQQQPVIPTLPFPDTPMPATPLIRVLETIDLSSTNVEHFLTIKNQPPPASSAEKRSYRVPE